MLQELILSNQLKMFASWMWAFAHTVETLDWDNPRNVLQMDLSYSDKLSLIEV